LASFPEWDRAALGDGKKQRQVMAKVAIKARAMPGPRSFLKKGIGAKSF
jgi:hypothetical protein